MDKRKLAKRLRKATKSVIGSADFIRKQHMFAKYQKTMDIVDRQAHYSMCKEQEAELVNATREIGACITSITEELKLAYDHLTILTKKQARLYEEEMLAQQEAAEKLAEEMEAKEAERKKLLDNHGFRGPDGKRIVEDGRIVRYSGKGSVKRRKLILPTDRSFYE